MRQSNPCYYCTEKRSSGCQENCEAYRQYIEFLSTKTYTNKETHEMTKLQRYETAKRALQEKELTPQEYEKAIGELARRLKI